MNRGRFEYDGLAFSYLDAGGDGPVILVLHAHWMEGRTFARLAAALAPSWRVVALDQRGHGDSDHAPSYRREDYMGDINALYEHVGLREAVLLGNSLGGVNAYEFAARHPEKVRALVIEDIGVEIADEMSMVLQWEGVFATRGALAERIGPRLAPYLEESFRQTADGWKLAFEPREMIASQSFLNGNHWADWLVSTCPALLIRGATSRVTNEAQMLQMAERRPNTTLITMQGGHVVHVDDPDGFAAAVREFLAARL